MSNESNKDLKHNIFNCIILLYNRVLSYFSKSSGPPGDKINNKTKMSLSWKKDVSKDKKLDNEFDVISVTVKKVTIKKNDKNEN